MIKPKIDSIDKLLSLFKKYEFCPVTNQELEKLGIKYLLPKNELDNIKNGETVSLHHYNYNFKGIVTEEPTLEYDLLITEIEHYERDEMIEWKEKK